MNKWIKRHLLIFFIFGLIVGALFLLSRIVKAPITISEAHADEVKPERDDLDRLIDRLAYCESRNNEKAINPADPDTASLGLLQFKIETFYRYNLRYKIVPEIEKGEIENVIFDGEVQRKLAKEILKDGGWKNWFNCLKPYFL